MKRLLFLLVMISAIHVSASAQERGGSAGGGEIVLTEESTLDDYLSYAALHNPGLEAAFRQWQAARAMIPQARALPDPWFTLSYNVKEGNEAIDPQLSSLALSQMLPWPGKLKSQGAAAARAADAAEQQYVAEKLGLFYRIKQAYHEYYYLARAVEIAEENVQLLAYLQDVTLTSYASGKGSHADAIKAQIELGKVEDLLSSLRDNRRPIMAQLNAELNRPADASLPWPRRSDDGEAIFTDEEIFAWFRENPNLKAADFDAESRRAEWSLAKKQYIPDLMLGLSVNNGGSSLMGGMGGMGSSGNNQVMASFSFSIPVWFGKYRAQARQKQAQYWAALDQRTDMENKLASELEAALFSYRDAERKKNLYDESLIPKARQHFEATRQAYTGGSTSLLDVIDAQRTLLDFSLMLERAKADRAQRLAELEMRVGRQLPRSSAE